MRKFMKKLQNIPGGKSFHKRMTSPIEPVKFDPAAVKKGNEVDISGFVAEYAGDAVQVFAALDDLQKRIGSRHRNKKTVTLKINVSGIAGKERSFDHEIIVAPSLVTINAPGAYGAARAIRRLAVRIELRRAPFLSTGRWDSSECMSPALTHSAFKSDSWDALDGGFAYDENYLRRIALAGYTGFHINVAALIFGKSALFPELDYAGADDNIKELNEICEKADKIGLQVFLSLYQRPLPGDHPLFVRLPHLRGSRMVASDRFYVLCSTSDEVRDYYAEQMNRLFTQVPLLGGVVTISGCEGWLHCHTACAPDSCPNCAGKDIEKETAIMFNRMAAAVKEASPQAHFIVWNYGIFAWTDGGAAKFISHLSQNCSVMANFDTGDDFKLHGASGTAFDYSLRCVGPSTSAQIQKDAAAKRGITFTVKSESGAPLEFCSLAYVPALTRWQRKYDRMAANASGALFNWKFIGYNGALAQKCAGFTSLGENKKLLSKMAVNTFGENNAASALKAWKFFDKAMDHHPFSIGSAGYFKGPFFIGPCQPLFLNEPKVLPELFLNRSGNRPVWMTTLSFVEPFGVKAFLKAVSKMRSLWQQGCEALSGCSGADRALAELFLTFLETAINMTEFYAERDSFYWEVCSPEKVMQKVDRLGSIAKKELANTLRALEIVEKFPEIAFSFTYRHGISAEMLQWKIAHTENLLRKELPMMRYSKLFSRNRFPQWIDFE